MSILELKQKYLEELKEKGEGITPDQLRFFCLGKEFNDSLFVYSYDMKDGLTIQCMIK